MCGIFGCIVNKESSFQKSELGHIFKNLALLSESRGKDSSGLALLDNESKTIELIKGNIRIKELIKNKNAIPILSRVFDKATSNFPILAFGHSRLVTHGSQLVEFNNQPVLKDDILTVHNGIIVNTDLLWNKNTDLKREFQIDTEIINSTLQKYFRIEDKIEIAIAKSLKQLKGTYSIASYFSNLNSILLSTNNGSLYYVSDFKNFLFFASEEMFLRKSFDNTNVSDKISQYEIVQLKPNENIWIDISNFSISKVDKNTPKPQYQNYFVNKSVILDQSFKKELVIDPCLYVNRNTEGHLFRKLEYNIEAISKIKRCTRCILPETFPFISFDIQGVCNYCKNYHKKEYPSDLNKLRQLVEPYRKVDGSNDCIVPFSGGRDSTYALHIIKNELNLNPITLTYDWGMVTDLARRNIARVCGELGVENVLVSANIKWKRENIRKNVEAWLNRPSLGMIPLFMAGDKYFFYYTEQLKKQTGIKLNIWGINHLENTDFKIGFAGIKPEFEKDRIYDISLLNKLKLFGFVGRNVIQSPGYINQSILDSLGSFAVRYFSTKKDYYHLFDHYKWDENEINELLQEKYAWEKAIDTDSTWRIGDGTASFYNYIYYTVAGFSEFDTFRSNQIREGMLDRKAALSLIYKENFPRYETLRWYLEIIGIDFTKAIEKINKIPKKYEL
jgi:glucosamine--fructose-6-phosphate aminotransferase (isomerizing)